VGSAGRRALLGRLAALGWFARRGEVATTQAMAMLLDIPELHAATLSLVTERTGVDLSTITRFQAEAVHEDAGRPDLEGLDEEGCPLLMVEAKFGAVMTPGQVRAYVQDQDRRVVDRRGVVAVLVPPHRVVEAQLLIAQVRDEWASAGLSHGDTAMVVLDWGTLLDRWEAAVAHLPSGPDSVAADLVQLRELCLTLGGLYMRPFGLAAAGPDWRGRADDLAIIVDQVTRRLLPPDDRTWPVQQEDGYAPFRYLPGGYPMPGSACAVGLSSRFADEGGSTLWLRYHRQTPHFRAISDRLLATDLRPTVRTDQGHLWLPLTVRADLSGELLVDDLVGQVRAVHALLLPPANRR